MTKKLSKQLCELCNIPFERHIYNYRVVDNDGDLCEQYVEILDFGKPENFVKLLEIVSRRSSVSFCHNGSYFGCSIHYYFKDIFEADEGTIQHNFLNTLLKQDLKNPCKPKLLEQIKQTIKEQEWHYD